jgi:hypothetical protein
VYASLGWDVDCIFAQSVLTFGGVKYNTWGKLWAAHGDLPADPARYVRREVFHSLAPMAASIPSTVTTSQVETLL